MRGAESLEGATHMKKALLSVILGASLLAPTVAAVPAAQAAPTRTISRAITPQVGVPSTCGGTAAGNTQFRAVHFNVLGSRFTSAASWSSRRSVVLKRMTHVLSNSSADKASIYGLTEANATEVSSLRSGLGTNYAVAVQYHLQGIIYNKSQWRVMDTGKYAFKTNYTAEHSFVHARLKHIATGRQINVIEAHLVPNYGGVDRSAARRAQLAQIEDTVSGWVNPVLIMGDMNWTSPGFENAVRSSFCSVRRDAATYFPSGASYYGTKGFSAYPSGNKYGVGYPILDYALVRNGVTMNGYRVLRGTFDNKAAGSDHHMLTLHLKI